MAELTTNFYINQANSFVEDVQDTRNTYYVFAAKATPWDNDSNPPAAADSVEQTNLQVYKDLLFGKLLANSDVSLLVPRYDWTPNTVYAAYDQTDAQLFDKQFFVVNDQYQVYKCIYNNGGRPSTIEPRLTAASGTFSTADGYIWKYMYTVDSQANTKFTSDEYVPVSTDANVSAAAVGGTIDAYKIANGGTGYSISETGFIFKLIDRYTIQLPSSSSANDNHYARSSIYLRSGFGSGQVREISSYNGATKQIRVPTSTPFDTYYKLDFESTPTGFVTIGTFVEQQYDFVQYLYLSNNASFSFGSTIIQSDTGTSGTILSANASVLRVQKTDPSATFSLNLPIRDSSQSGSSRTGTVSVTAGGSNVTGSGTQFTNTTTGYTVGSYIRVGSNANNQIRRVVSITNNTLLTVASNFTNTLVSNVHFFVPIAAEPTSVTVSRANGTVSNTNLSSLQLTVSNASTVGASFIIGEQVTQVTSANTDAGANGIVAFSNTTTVILSSVTGSWITGLFARGSSSQLRYQVDSIDTRPNVTLSEPAGDFVVGFPVTFRSSPTSNVVTGNAVVRAVTTLPNDQTEYTIAPTVLVEGDGSGAEAIAVVNTSFGSLNEITGVEIISPGSGYTTANVSVYANNSYGSGALAAAIIAPVTGHGKNSAYELGARYVGVTKQFDSGINEGFFFPTYGEFRKFGIIQNPEFEDVRVTLDNFDRINLEISGRSTVSPNVSITTWVPGEVVVQPTTKAAGVVVVGNNTVVQLKNLLGTFEVSNTDANSKIVSYYSNTTANVTSSVGIIRFQVTTDSAAEFITQLGSGATGEVTAVPSNTVVFLSNVVGKFATGDTMVDTSVNAYAIVNSISTANGSRDVTTSFGDRFNQTMRITLTANVGSFSNGETVVQDITNAYGTVVTDRDELDLVITVTSGTFTTGQRVVSQNTGAVGYISSSNSTYLKLTGVSQNASFSSGHVINNELNSTANVTGVYPVLLLNNVDGPNRFQAGPNNIIGQTTGATGVCNSYSLIQYPELVRDTGRVVYLDNVQPVTRSDRSKEEVRLVIKF